MNANSIDLGSLNPGSTATPLEPVFHLGYRRWLDGLRGIAILVVVLLHLGLLRGGSIGVDIFFVLSGFLITSLLIEEWQNRGAIDFKRFFLRRALRLAPAFVVLLAVYVGYLVWIMPADERNRGWLELLAVAGYVANWSSIHGITISKLGHTWSLSLEEQFYLIWPVLLYVMLRNLTRRQIVAIVVAGILASALWRAYLHHEHRILGTAAVDSGRLYSGLDTRADSLLAGCLASMIASWNLLPTTRLARLLLTTAAIWGTIVVAFCLSQRDLGSSQNFDGLFTVTAFGVGAIILRLLQARVPIVSKILESTPLVGLGRISYGLYLFHMPIITWVPWLEFGWNKGVTLAVVSCVCLSAALLSYFLIEQPFLRLKRSGPRPVANEDALQSLASRRAA